MCLYHPTGLVELWEAAVQDGGAGVEKKAAGNASSPLG